MLSAPIRDADTLRRQAEMAQVTGGCECGCATIDLAVDGEAIAWTSTSGVGRVVASAFSRYHVKKRAALLLDVVNGLLAELEIVDVDGSGAQADFPPLEVWGPLIVGAPADTVR